METRLLRQTGLVVSRLGPGLAALAWPRSINLEHADDLYSDYLVASMEAHADAVLDTAWVACTRAR